MIRAVYDTNVFISSIFWSGNPRKCIWLARRRWISLAVSQPILDEIKEKLRFKFFFTLHESRLIIEDIKTYAEVVSPKFSLHIVQDDPDDDKFLECAMEFQAEYIVSGDKHLISLGSYQGILIVNPRRFIEIYKLQNL